LVIDGLWNRTLRVNKALTVSGDFTLARGTIGGGSSQLVHEKQARLRERAVAHLQTRLRALP
jgi:hypothetical protein